MDQAEHADAAHRGQEGPLVLDQAPRVTVGSGEGGRIGGAVGRLDPHHLAAGDDEVERAHEVRERPPAQAGAVRGGRDDAGDRLGVVAAHVRQREALAVERGVEGAHGRPAQHSHEPPSGGSGRSVPSSSSTSPPSRSGSARKPSVSAMSDHAWPAPTRRTVVPSCSARRTSATRSSSEPGWTISRGRQRWLPVWLRHSALRPAPPPAARRRAPPAPRSSSRG